MTFVTSVSVISHRAHDITSQFPHGNFRQLFKQTNYYAAIMHTHLIQAFPNGKPSK